LDREERAIAWVGVIGLLLEIVFQFFQFFGITPAFLVPYSLHIGIGFASIIIIAVVIFIFRWFNTAKQTVNPMPTVLSVTNEKNLKTYKTNLELEPLEHVKGTGSDVPPSQMIFGYYGDHVRDPKNEYIAKFGVIRVKAKKGNMVNCHATARIKILQEMGRPNPHKWEDIGTLNWFLQENKERFDGKFSQLAHGKDYGLNKFLKNEKIDILEGHEKDLLVMYMINGCEKVFMCNQGDTMVIGWVEGTDFIEFILELSFSALNVSTTTYQYKIKMLWDDYSMCQI